MLKFFMTNRWTNAQTNEYAENNVLPPLSQTKQNRPPPPKKNE